MFPEKLQQKLQQRIENSTLRELGKYRKRSIDFCSNDYLGFAKSKNISKNTYKVCQKKLINKNGATGSRLISGNNIYYNELETFLSKIYQVEKALVFNSGYTANIGFFATIPQRGDVIIYDELIHASIRDGIQLSNAKSYKFKHNDCNDLALLLEKNKNKFSEIYVVTESIFSMDGDAPDLHKIVEITQKHQAHFIVDEAHALGVFKLGLVQQLNLEDKVFARILTFGKALGCHGAVILGSNQLIKYLINFCRAFIYTTGLSPHSVINIKIAHQELLHSNGNKAYLNLQNNITHFSKGIERLDLNFTPSNSAIHCCIISGNKKVKKIAKNLQELGIDVKPILSPTVKKEKERLRFCLHSYNTHEEIDNTLDYLNHFIKSYK